MKHTGVAIMSRRETIGMSREQLAKKLSTRKKKWTRLKVWRIETGVTPVRADDLPRIATALETTVAELLA